jgi:hypothetical protein
VTRKIEPSEIKKLYLRAIKLGTKKGLGEDAFDFASWLAVKWLEGKSLHQTLDQSLIDYMRVRYGHDRSEGAKARKDAVFVPLREIES